MAKRNRQAKADAPGESAPPNNPFAALAGLSGVAPKANGGEPEAAPPSADAAEPARDLGSFGQKIVLQREKKGRKGKTVTRVRGLPEPERWQTEFKKRLGCGATLEDGELVLLGDLAERAAELLAALGAKRVVIGN